MAEEKRPEDEQEKEVEAIEIIEEVQQAEEEALIENVVFIRRTAAVVKGGRRFSFGVLAIVGDGSGRVGYGYGKAREVPVAVAKATQEAKRSMIEIPLVGTTIPHEVYGRFKASTVMLKPAAPGSGIKAGPTVRSIMEAAGITDVLTKSLGSNTPINVVKATFVALGMLRSREESYSLRFGR